MRRRRGSHRRRDDHRARRDDPDDRHRGPDVRRGTAWHPGSGAGASSRGSAGDHRDAGHPDRPGDDRHRPAEPHRRRDGDHPDREPDAVRRDADHPDREPDAVPDARSERRSTGCCRRAAPSDPASDPERPGAQEHRRARRARPGPAERESVPTGPAQPDAAVRASAPMRPEPAEPGSVQTVLPAPAEPASGRGAEHPAWGRTRRPRFRCRRTPAPRHHRWRRGTIHADVAPRVLPPWTTPTSRTRPAPSSERVDPYW
ncbi:hypothetical protein RhoFasK5_00023|nr:hypothetical protein [Rhodococcus kroppenstedtii]